MIFAIIGFLFCLQLYFAYRASLIFDDEDESVRAFGKAFMGGIVYLATLYFDKSTFSSLPESKQQKVRNLFHAYVLTGVISLLIILILIAL